MNKFHLAVLVSVFITIKLISQDTVAYDLTLPEVAINQSRIKDYKSITLKYESIDSTYIFYSRGLGLGDILQKSTGLFTASTENFSQDMRISIRGFGMRSAFGIRGIKMTLDGLPESTPDGQADVDNIDPALLSNVSILKGPASGVYSNASGGVIEMKSRWPEQRNEIGIKSTVGSFGLYRTSLFLGQNREKRKLLISVGGLKYNGYRSHNAYTNYTFMLKSLFVLPNSTLQVIANGFNSPKAQDPGGITLEQSQTDPRSARLQNEDFNAGEQVNQQKLGIIYQKNIQANNLWQSTGFIARRSFTNQLPFTNGGQVNFARLFFGGNTSVSFFDPFTKNGRLDVGLEAESQTDQRQRNDNLKTGPGTLRLDQDESFSNVGLFTKYHYNPSNLSLVFNARAERIALQLKDNFSGDGDQSGNLAFMPLSGGLDFSYNVSGHFSFNAAVGTGFETPTLSEIGNNPNGGGFAELSPARTFNKEAGISLQSKKWSAKTNFFHTTSSNELLPYELSSSPGRIFYKNGGKSLRMGLEYELSFSPLSKTKLGVNGVINQMTFTNDQKISLRLPGLPASQVATNINTPLFKKVNFNGQVRYQGQIFANEGNTVSIKPVWFSNFGIQSAINIGKISIEPNAGIQYVLSDVYYSNIFINAAGGRYYEAGPKTNLYLSVKISFL